MAGSDPPEFKFKGKLKLYTASSSSKRELPIGYMPKREAPRADFRGY
jgi:hypothetical protein